MVETRMQDQRLEAEPDRLLTPDAARALFGGSASTPLFAPISRSQMHVVMYFPKYLTSCGWPPIIATWARARRVNGPWVPESNRGL